MLLLVYTKTTNPQHYSCYCKHGLMGPYSVNFSAAFDVGPSLRYIIYRSHRSVHVMLKFFDNIRSICGKKLYVKVFKRNTGKGLSSLHHVLLSSSIMAQ